VGERACLVAVADGEVGGGADLVRPPGREKLAPAEHDSEMRSVELVRRAQEHVDARARDVDRPVRCVVHCVDPGERAGFVRKRRDLGHRRDGPDGVRCPWERDDARPLGEQRPQLVEVEPTLVVDVREADRQALVVRELEPGCDVAVVVEPRADHLVALPPVA